MGDRLQRGGRRTGRGALSEPQPVHGGRRVGAISPLDTWGLSPPQASLGHNNGPPLDEPDIDLYVRWKWRAVYREVWKTPSPAVARLRVARAEAAGVDYRTYMLVLLDTGRHLQRADAVELGIARPGDDVLASPEAEAVLEAWFSAVRALDVPPRATERALAFGHALCAAYSGPDRHWPTLLHLAKMLRLADKADPALGTVTHPSLPTRSHQARSALILAVLLHAVVFDPQRNDNAARSAALADRWLAELGIREGARENVSRLIEATSRTLSPDDLSTDARLLVDLERAHLAAPWEQFLAAERARRQGHPHLSDDLWHARRATEIEALLASRHLFLTPDGLARWDILARRNLRAQLQILAKLTA
jgi:predicted metal-dependent HD superfamily phosphohydrolase